MLTSLITRDCCLIQPNKSFSCSVLSVTQSSMVILTVVWSTASLLMWATAALQGFLVPNETTLSERSFSFLPKINSGAVLTVRSTLLLTSVNERVHLFGIVLAKRPAELSTIVLSTMVLSFFFDMIVSRLGDVVDADVVVVTIPLFWMVLATLDRRLTAGLSFTHRR